MLELLLPYIDSTLRQLEHLPEQLPEKLSEVSKPDAANTNEDEIIGTLSSREIDIMHWVKSGKTNLEIGQILDISAFTVKNHLQRIFKKLDVMNRAQAVTQYQQMYPD
jgi:transcriptional regulator EpsA